MSRVLGNQLGSSRETLCYRLVLLAQPMCQPGGGAVLEHGRHVHDFSPSPNGASCCCPEQACERFDRERWGTKSTGCCLAHPPVCPCHSLSSFLLTALCRNVISCHRDPPASM